MSPVLVALFGTLGPAELAIIALIALLLFGARLPKLARSLGQSVTEFKSGLKQAKEGVDDGDDAATKD